MDWVVNDDTYGTSSETQIPNSTLVANVLTIPQREQDQPAGGGAFTWGGFAFPEQKGGQVAYAVRGHYALTPSNWAIGSSFRAIVRLVVKPFEYQSVGGAILDANYTCDQAAFANERFLWQRVHYEQFGAGDYGEAFQLSWKGKCFIPEDSALFLIIENISGFTQSIVSRQWLRTLLRAN